MGPPTIPARFTMVFDPAWRHVAAALALACSVGVSASAQDVGAIRGTVQDNTGAVLPGVTVVLSNPGVIGGNQQAVTDDRGAYQFTSLVPGNTYAVRAVLVGFRPVSIDRIVVNASVTVRADITLQLGQVAEEVTVSVVGSNSRKCG